MRGEYSSPSARAKGLWELPPHARRIRMVFSAFCSRFGTTSACAENTTKAKMMKRSKENYLRMRGEYISAMPYFSNAWELPPHARRIHVQKRGDFLVCGTTSACAENTVLHHITSFSSRNYLRMRGEYCAQRSQLGYHMELPPHARRILLAGLGEQNLGGTTSACAENTLNELGLL